MFARKYVGTFFKNKSYGTIPWNMRLQGFPSLVSYTMFKICESNYHAWEWILQYYLGRDFMSTTETAKIEWKVVFENICISVSFSFLASLQLSLISQNNIWISVHFRRNLEYNCSSSSMRVAVSSMEVWWHSWVVRWYLPKSITRRWSDLKNQEIRWILFKVNRLGDFYHLLKLSKRVSFNNMLKVNFLNVRYFVLSSS